MGPFGNHTHKNNTTAPTTTSIPNSGMAGNMNVTVPPTAAPSYNINYTTNTVIGTTPYPSSLYGGAAGIGNFSIGAAYQSNDIFSLRDTSNKELVKMNNDGSITWSQDVKIDDAAEAFARTLRIGAEISIGITRKVKSEMRDTVFEEIISLAKMKGSLTLDDLTFMYEASKIMEKLKGGRE